jgi:hypothetical protein
MRNRIQEFKEWFEDGNVIEVEHKVYATQCHLYKNKVRGLDNLYDWFIREFYNDDLHEEARDMMDFLDLKYKRKDSHSLYEYYLEYKEEHTEKENKLIIDLVNKF